MRHASRSLGALALIATSDILAQPGRRWWVKGALDELAHLATAAVLLSPFGLDRRERPHAYAASVLFDVDHVPEYLFGSLVLSRRTRRPFSHSVPPVFAIGCLARPGSVPRGVVAGLLAHLGRDLADADGVPLVWPFSARPFRVPYALYSAALALSRSAPLRRA